MAMIKICEVQLKTLFGRLISEVRSNVHLFQKKISINTIIFVVAQRRVG